MRNTIKNITFFAALALLSVSCVEDKMGGYVNDGVIRYDLDNTAPVVAKSSQDAEELSPIVLTSEDGKYSFTLQRSVRPTAIEEAVSKAAPITGKTLKDNYNDGSLQITAFKGTDTYMSQQKLIFVSQEGGQTASLWKTGNIFYWPVSGSLDFWSWAPYSSAEAAGKINNVSFNDNKMTFTYTSPKSSAELGCDAELQKDVLLAYDKASDIDRRNVSLMYKHALSGIRFQVDRANKCMVKSVTLGNVYSKGDCSFDGSNITWSNQSEPQTFTESFGTAINEYLKDDYANPQDLDKSTDGTKTFLFIPQSATDDKKVKMTLVVRLDGAEEDLTLSAELDPADVIWEAGWTYTYGVEFNPGYSIQLKGTTTDSKSECYYVGGYVDVKVQSFYTIQEGKAPVSWHLEYANTESGPFKKFSELSSSDIAKQMFSAPNAGGGSVEYSDIKIPVFPSEATEGGIIGDHGKIHTANLRARSVIGSETEYRDLSLYDVNGNPLGSRSTANCYVVHAPGFYRFPMVYGNGIKNGEANEQAFRNNRQGTSSGYWCHLLNHANAFIFSPYIETMCNVNPGEYSAVLLWQDELGVISYTDVMFEANDNQSGYVTFIVNPEMIHECNAVIALKKGDAIVWSWQIWVKDESVRASNPVTRGGKTYRFMDSYLGYCSGGNVYAQTTYPERSCWVRAVQDSEPGAVSNAVQIVQNKNDFGFEGESWWTASYYQWGRKDPMFGSRGLTTDARYKLIWGNKGQESSETNVGHMVSSLGESIQNPTSFYYDPEPDLTCQWIDNKTYRYTYLWDMNLMPNYTAFNTMDSDVIKSIYDPAPVGFKVPCQNAVQALTSGNGSVAGPHHWNDRVESDGADGHPESLTFEDAGISLPVLGFRHPMNGWIVNIYIGHSWTSSPGHIVNTASDSQQYSFYNWSNDLRFYNTGTPGADYVWPQTQYITELSLYHAGHTGDGVTICPMTDE